LKFPQSPKTKSFPYGEEIFLFSFFGINGQRQLGDESYRSTLLSEGQPAVSTPLGTLVSAHRPNEQKPRPVAQLQVFCAKNGKNKGGLFLDVCLNGSATAR